MKPITFASGAGQLQFTDFSFEQGETTITKLIERAIKIEGQKLALKQFAPSLANILNARSVEFEAGIIIGGGDGDTAEILFWEPGSGWSHRKVSITAHVKGGTLVAIVVPF
jgi:hypothetical protein